MEFTQYIQALLALVAVLGLIGLASWAARRFGLAGMRALPRRERRLAIAEVLAVDNRRRLVLVRRDAVEHLILIGGTSDLVVERGIASLAPHAAAAQEPT